MAERRRLVVVGGVAAGLSAAARAKRLDPNLQVCVFERTGFCSYTACGLPYFVGGVIRRHTDLLVRTPEDMSAEGVSVEVNHDVLSIDPQAGRLAARALRDGTEREEPYDELMLAPGGQPRLPLQGMDLPGGFMVRTVEDGIGIRDWIEGQRPGRAVIVGGGYIGLEMAEALRELGRSM